MHTTEIGRQGEDLALGFYRLCGYTCLARRWRRGGGEIDLIVSRPQLVVFVEVKVRGPGSHATAAETVSPQQLRRLRGLARRWCHEHGTLGAALRLDVVTIDLAGDGRGLVLRHFASVDGPAGR
jgi:putative endonuclease